MAKKEALENKTVEELRELAAKKNVEGRSGMAKEDLVNALANDAGTPSKGTPSEPKPDYPAQYPIAGITIKGEGKANARLFQTSPDVKEYLTRDEAKAKGFYWADTDEERDRNIRGDRTT